ncbi:MAG: PilZ domain-containing protein [Candidatus Hydrogenedentes bacterium]|nr:PilZ domain-containing protein [Candidatus Hydrogenedentota bacterium]
MEKLFPLLRNDSGIMNTPLLWVGVAFLALMAAAIALEFRRQRAARRQRMAAEWKTVEEILREKELSDDEAGVLRATIQRWSSDDPLRAVTVRQHFDSCIEQEMDALHRRGDRRDFERSGLLLHDVRTRLGLDFIPYGQRILSTRELNLGQVIFISGAGQGSTAGLRVTVSAVDEAYFYGRLSDPGASSKPAWKENEEVRCRMWRDDDARYTFVAHFVRYEEEPPACVFRHTAELSRIQSRAHYRVRYSQPASVGVLNAPVNGNEDDLRARRVVTKLRGRITSLSAGGLALIVPQPIPRQVLLRIGLQLPEGEPFEVEASIIFASSLSGGDHLVRVTFVGISDETRDRIARYVLHRQQFLVAAGEHSE